MTAGCERANCFDENCLCRIVSNWLPPDLIEAGLLCRSPITWCALIKVVYVILASLYGTDCQQGSSEGEDGVSGGKTSECKSFIVSLTTSLPCHLPFRHPRSACLQTWTEFCMSGRPPLKSMECNQLLTLLSFFLQKSPFWNFTRGNVRYFWKIWCHQTDKIVR